MVHIIANKTCHKKIKKKTYWKYTHSYIAFIDLLGGKINSINFYNQNNIYNFITKIIMIRNV